MVPLLFKGDVPVIFRQVNGAQTRAILRGAKTSDKIDVDLNSLTAMMDNGAVLGSDGNNNITLTKNGNQVVCDRRIHTPGGWVGGVEMIPDVARFRQLKRLEELELAKAATESKRSIDVNLLHSALTHPSMETTRATAAANGWRLTGEASVCQDCAIAKARQRNSHLNPGDMLMLDISSPGESLDKNKHMCVVMDAKSGHTWLFVLKRKSHLTGVVMRLIKKLKDSFDMKVKVIRCDGGGENVKLRSVCDKEGYNIAFEFTAPNTPQHNGRVERKIAEVYKRIRAMMAESGLPLDVFKPLWPYAAHLVIAMDNAIVRKAGGKSANDLFYGDTVSRPTTLGNIPPERHFGEICICANRVKIKNKFADQGNKCLWIGYAPDYSDHTHLLYNIETGKVIHSRDVIFLNQTYGAMKVASALREAQRVSIL